MINELPLKPWTNECGIFNLNNSDQDGSHWVAWIKEGDLKIYFDSFGIKPPKELVKYLGEKNLQFTTRKYQDFNDPPVCGHLCLEFIKNFKNFI